MKSSILSIFTRTPLHVGAGSSVGIVDLPIIRERHTGYPVIPGSSLKGVLADLWPEDLEKGDDGKYVRKAKSDLESLFGKNRDSKCPEMGNLLIGESKIITFPVRSAKGGFAWITCPLALGRLYREMKVALPNMMTGDDQCFASEALKLDDCIILEEYPIKFKNAVSADVVSLLKKLSKDTLWQSELERHLAIVSDEMFKYFVENTCEIAQHVKIDDETGTAEDSALFNQENIPAETMFGVKIYEKTAGILNKLNEKLKEHNNLVQIGADLTTGLGWCSIETAE